jgi:hypothetical protein
MMSNQFLAERTAKNWFIRVRPASVGHPTAARNLESSVEPAPQLRLTLLTTLPDVSM